jgi:hypothetical protein
MARTTEAEVSISNYGEDENGRLRVKAGGTSWRGCVPEAIGSAIALATLRAECGLLTLAFAVRARQAEKEVGEHLTAGEVQLLAAADLMIDEFKNRPADQNEQVF